MMTCFLCTISLHQCWELVICPRDLYEILQENNAVFQVQIQIFIMLMWFLVTKKKNHILTGSRSKNTYSMNTDLARWACPPRIFKLHSSSLLPPIKKKKNNNSTSLASLQPQTVFTKPQPTLRLVDFIYETHNSPLKIRVPFSMSVM